MTALNKYVGIPHLDHGHGPDGADCWGLARFVYRSELGIELPGFDDAYQGTRERGPLHDLIATQSSQAPWCTVRVGQPFDLILRRVGRYATHIGVIVGPEHALHVHRKRTSVIARLSDAFPRDAVIGTFRHEARL